MLPATTSRPAARHGDGLAGQQRFVHLGAPLSPAHRRPERPAPPARAPRRRAQAAHADRSWLPSAATRSAVSGRRASAAPGLRRAGGGRAIPGSGGQQEAHEHGQRVEIHLVPKTPSGSKVAPMLATKVTSRCPAPPAHPCRCAARAASARHRGRTARRQTTSRAADSTQLPQFSNCRMIGASSPARPHSWAWPSSSPAWRRSWPRTGATAPPVSAGAGSRRRGGVGHGVIAGRAHGIDQRRRAQLGRIPAHGGALRGGTDAGALRTPGPPSAGPAR
jgi:hypothetical protein